MCHLGSKSHSLALQSSAPRPSLPISLVLGMQQMEDALSILRLSANLKTATLRHLSRFYSLSFHTEWRKTAFSCTCLSASLVPYSIQKTPPLLGDLLRSGEMAWSKNKSYLPYRTASSLRRVNYWPCKTSLSWNEMEEKNIFIMNCSGGLSSFSRIWEFDLVSFACKEARYPRQWAF